MTDYDELFLWGAITLFAAMFLVLLFGLISSFHIYMTCDSTEFETVLDFTASAGGFGHNDLVTVTTESNRTLLLKYWAGVQTGAVIEKCGQDWRVKSEEDLK